MSKEQLSYRQKLEALAYKYYQGQEWVPKKGDLYTTSRADLEMYEIYDVTEDKIYTKYMQPDSPIAEWSKENFLTEGFGPRRVWVPDWILHI